MLYPVAATREFAAQMNLTRVPRVIMDNDFQRFPRILGDDSDGLGVRKIASTLVAATACWK